MEQDINSFIISGRLDADPELRIVPKDNYPVATFVIVNTRWYENKDTPTGFEQDVQRFFAVVWGELGELANKNLKMGDKVWLTGHIQINYQDMLWRNTDRIIQIIVANFGLIEPYK